MNAGEYCFDIVALNKLSNNNSQGEYYLINVVALINSSNTYIGTDVIIDKDTIVYYLGNVIEGNNVIG